MAKSTSPPPGDDDQKIADAELLFSDTPKSKPKPKPAPPASTRPSDDLDHSYDLVKGHNAPSESEAAPVPPIPAPAAPAAPRKPKPKLEGEGPVPTGPPATVDQVWSRGAEWGGNLFIL